MDTAPTIPPTIPPIPAVRTRLPEPRWVIPALIGVGCLAAFLYLWNVTVSGYCNTYYAMAAQAAAQDWTAFYFGSLDAGSFITLDKPPLSTWVMGLSVRLFGLSAASVLVPQALAGVATVLILFAAVRRSFEPAAGIVAALVAALTPAPDGRAARRLPAEQDEAVLPYREALHVQRIRNRFFARLEELVAARLAELRAG